MPHKTVGLRLRGKGGNVVVERMGQSPRGQRFIIDSVQVSKEGKTKAEFRAAIQVATKELLAQLEINI